MLTYIIQVLYVMLFHLKKIIMTIISVIIQLCVSISLGIHKTACSIDLFSGRPYCVETRHLIREAYRLTVFFRSGDVYWWGFSRRLYDNIFFSLALSLLDFLSLSWTNFEYSVYLIFCINFFFSTQKYAFLMSKG